jgi:hypothetical protein
MSGLRAHRYTPVRSLALTVLLDPSAIRKGRVHARYFRENFAQGGIDLVQIIPELVTNADAAIAASGRLCGRIVLAFGPPDPAFLARWRAELRRARAPAITDWRNELRCTDDGIGVNASTVDARLGALGVAPDHADQRGLFGRGLRDVWLAQGGGRIEGVRDGHAVESWFFPAPGDAPYGFAHVVDEPAGAAHARALGVDVSGTRVTVPLAVRSLPVNARLRRLVAQLVQIRPVLADLQRELWLELPGEAPTLIMEPNIEPDAERPLLFDDEVTVQTGVTARVTVRRAADPIPLSPSRATRLGGLLILSGRAAHETTLGGFEGAPGARHLFGEVRCEMIETLQRRALDSPRPQVVVRVDRGGLNEHHPLVRHLNAAVDRVLAPIVAEEERRADAHVVRAGRALRVRDEVGLRALNDALRNAFDAPGSAGFASGGRGSSQPLQIDEEARRSRASPASDAVAAGSDVDATLAPAMRFKRSPVRLHPGETRGVSLIVDPQRIRVGTPVSIQADPGIRFKPWGETIVPEPHRGGWSRISGSLRARVTIEPGERLVVTAQAGEHVAELEVIVVRHRSSGWVREIARKDEDALIEAHFDHENGVVTVFEGRREFKALEKAARASGLPKARLREYLPYRMLEVEVAANAVYAWAAEQIVGRRVSGEDRLNGAEFAAAVRHEAQALRYRTHEKLMRAFLDPEVFDGGVRIVGNDLRGGPGQTELALES